MSQYVLLSGLTVLMALAAFALWRTRPRSVSASEQQTPITNRRQESPAQEAAVHAPAFAGEAAADRSQSAPAVTDWEHLKHVLDDDIKIPFGPPDNDFQVETRKRCLQHCLELVKTSPAVPQPKPGDSAELVDGITTWLSEFVDAYRRFVADCWKNTRESTVSDPSGLEKALTELWRLRTIARALPDSEPVVASALQNVARAYALLAGYAQMLLRLLVAETPDQVAAILDVAQRQIDLVIHVLSEPTRDIPEASLIDRWAAALAAPLPESHECVPRDFLLRIGEILEILVLDVSPISPAQARYAAIQVDDGVRMLRQLEADAIATRIAYPVKRAFWSRVDEAIRDAHEYVHQVARLFDDLAKGKNDTQERETADAHLRACGEKVSAAAELLGSYRVAHSSAMPSSPVRRADRGSGGAGLGSFLRTVNRVFSEHNVSDFERRDRNEQNRRRRQVQREIERDFQAKRDAGQTTGWDEFANMLRTINRVTGPGASNRGKKRRRD